MEFDNLKNSYIAAVQWGLAVKVGYQESKRGNDILHKSCENFIDSSNYPDNDKKAMKKELDCLKELLSNEIESFYKR